ncbi:MAG: NAD-dependent epimerase/dehydratase family protein [Deltaproteobacteria bacterium]|nr:NAD-dependent epimerase/dehydratase family protein [Deltaproteobacteria bacterium]
MKTLVTGCSGLVGNALVEYLFKNGHSIQCLGRNSADHHAGFWLTESLRTDSDSNFNTVIHLAGENVARGRWTSKKKKLILNSRVDGTRELVDHISLMATKPNLFLCASAVGYYGSRGDEILDENRISGTCL